MRVSFERLRRDVHVQHVHFAADLRWWRNPERVWLHTDSDGDRVFWQELRLGFERLQRDIRLRELHVARDLRRRRNSERLRLHTDSDGDRVFW